MKENLINQYKRDVEELDKILEEIFGDSGLETSPYKIRSYHIQSLINFITKMIEELKGKKKDRLKFGEKEQLYFDGYNSALSDTISQLEDFKKFLEKELSAK